MQNSATTSWTTAGSGALDAGTSITARLRHRVSENRFLRNVLSNAGGNAINSVLQLGLLLLLSRLLSSPTLAAWLTAGSIIAIGECASDFGTRLWAVRQFAGSQDPRTILRQCLWNKLFYTSCAVAVLSLLPLNTLAASQFLLALAVAATQPSSDPVLWFLRGKDRLDVEAILVLSARLGIAVMAVVCGCLALPLEWLLCGWLLCNISRMLITLRLPICSVLREAEYRPKIAGVSKRWNGVLHVFPIGVSLVLAPFFTQAALLTLSIQGSDQDVNVFGIAFKLVIAAGFVGTSVVVSSYARLSEAVQNQDHSRIQTIVNQKCSLLTKVMLPICMLGILLGVPVTSLLLKAELKDVGVAMILLTPGLYLSCVNMAAKYTLNVFGRNWQDVSSMLLGFATFGIVYLVLTQTQVGQGISPVWVAAACWTISEFVVLLARMSFLGARFLAPHLPDAPCAGVQETEVQRSSNQSQGQIVFPVRSVLLSVCSLTLMSVIAFTLNHV